MPRRTPLLLLALVALAAGCAEIGEPELGTGIDVTPDTLLDNSETPDEEPGEVVSGAADLVFTPLRPEGYTPSIILATDTGSIVVESAEDGTLLDLPEQVLAEAQLPDPDDGADAEAAVEGEEAEAIDPETGEPVGDVVDPSTVPIGLVPAALAVDDYLGGLVVQSVAGDVRWAPSNAATTQLVSEGGARLLEVGFLQEALAVQVFLAVPGAIDRVGVADGEQLQFTVLEPGEEIIDFASSNGVQALVVGNDRCGEIRFLNASGETVDIGGPDSPLCADDRRPRFGSVALGPDGDRVAYTQIDYRDDGLPASTSVVVLELSTDSVLFAGTVGGSGEQIESLAYDGQRALFLRTSDTGRAAGMVEVSTGAAIDVPVVPGLQAVSFARLPLALVSEDAQADNEGALGN